MVTGLHRRSLEILISNFWQNEHWAYMETGTSEAIVLENLKRSSAVDDRVTVVVAHRLATVRNADHIIVMKDGSVEEEGQHDSLIKADGTYASLVKAQQFEKKQQDSSTSSVASDSHSSLKKDDSTTDEHVHRTMLKGKSDSVETAKTTSEILYRCFALSRRESPAIIVGAVSSIFSGGLILGEVCTLEITISRLLKPH